MIKVYKSGNDFIKENMEIISINPFFSKLFSGNSKSMDKTDKSNYAISYKNEDKQIVMLKLSPWSTLIQGDKYLSEKLIDYIIKEKYNFDSYLCEYDLGIYIKQYLNNNFNVEEFLVMDFMQATEISEESSSDVEKATEDDFEEILELSNMFIDELKLLDQINELKNKNVIKNYRVIKKDQKIISMAKHGTGEMKNNISMVYTLKEYKGMGFGRKIVNTLKNEILQTEDSVTLNVDIKNPISNHIYKSIGFKELFTMGQFVVNEK